MLYGSNEGALESYNENGIQKAEFLVSFDDRLCEECEALSGKEYPIGEAHGIIPVHPSCRCTFVPVI